MKKAIYFLTLLFISCGNDHEHAHGDHAHDDGHGHEKHNDAHDPAFQDTISTSGQAFFDSTTLPSDTFPVKPAEVNGNK